MSALPNAIGQSCCAACSGKRLKYYLHQARYNDREKRLNADSAFNNCKVKPPSLILSLRLFVLKPVLVPW